jgi:hypothetical protein
MNGSKARRIGGAVNTAAILGWLGLAPAVVASTMLGHGSPAITGPPSPGAGVLAFVSVLLTGAALTIRMAGRRRSRWDRRGDDRAGGS